MRRLRSLNHALLLPGQAVPGSWKADVPPGESTNSPFHYCRETCTTSCFILQLHSFYPLEISKGNHAKPRSYWPFVVWKRQQHRFHAPTTHSRSQLPVRLQVVVLRGTERVADRLAFPGPHCGTHQEGRKRIGLKNDRKKKPHSLQMKLQTRTTSSLKRILCFCQTHSAC